MFECPAPLALVIDQLLRINKIFFVSDLVGSLFLASGLIFVLPLHIYMYLYMYRYILNIFNCVCLLLFQLAHPVLQSLKGTEHGWLIDLLFAFNSGMYN